MNVDWAAKGLGMTTKTMQKTTWVWTMAMLAGVPTFGFAQQLPFLGKKKEPAPAASPTDRWNDKVAEVNGEPILRSELADELIGTYGAKQVDLLINRKLIEQACKAKKINITREELDTELTATLKRLNLKREEFVKRVLADREMTLGQYMRDTIWPKVALKKLVADKVVVSDEELQKAFTANFGEKVDVRMLVVRELKKAQDLWTKVDAEKDADKRLQLFEEMCKTYSIDEATKPFAGRCQPIGHYSTFGEIEQLAFSLRPSELSKIVTVQEGHLMLLCVAHIPARKDVTFTTPVDEKSKETVREFLTNDLKEKKQRIEIANSFKTMHDGAKFQNYFKNEFEAETLNPALIVKQPSTPSRSAN